MLDVRGITVSFGERTVLNDAALHVDRGEVVALLGPSGVGKSTFLRVVAGLLVPEAGEVWLDDVDLTRVAAHRRRIGLMFQDEQLFPHFDVASNIGFGLRMQRRPRSEVNERVQELLTLVGLDGFGGRSVGTLSGGEAKRVALARSLAPNPAVLLLDEPLTGLDRTLHDRLVADLAELLRATVTTAVLVTHDHDEAAAIAHRVVTWQADPS
jgi:thiamine transport system ATP-binding protein